LHFPAVRGTDSPLKLESAIQKKIEAWQSAGLIDAPTAERLSAYESAHERRTGLQWPVIVALLFGGILVAAGITLFVAAHWADMSPAARFTVVLAFVGVFHVAGAFTAEKFPALATTFHGIGTAALGAGIFLAAQIFNLHENWATGVLLWALGAAAGYALLRDWVQAAFVALLVPAWLISEWDVLTEYHRGGRLALGVGLSSLALCYLSARVGDQSSLVRRVLVWIGGLALIPAGAVGVALALEEGSRLNEHGVYGVWLERNSWLSSSTLALFWIVALGAPLLLAVFLRGRSGWKLAAWSAWAVITLWVARTAAVWHSNRPEDHRISTSAMYLLLALGSVGLVWWGLEEKRRERVNLGVAAFAITVLVFYFDGFIGKLGRSAGLVILGVLCLAGGYLLEKTRRKLVERMETRS
jgi:uncharacterized membrane protein